MIICTIYRKWYICSCLFQSHLWMMSNSNGREKASFPIAYWLLWLLMSCWHQQMATFSALLALCVGNSSVTGEFPSERPVTRSFYVFFDLHLKKRLSKKNREAGDLRRRRAHCDFIVMVVLTMVIDYDLSWPWLLSCLWLLYQSLWLWPRLWLLWS